MVGLELQLELERLRAERDAMAAELQMERAERLRAEERLRLLEREKFAQMRQGAASREKLASELEEARLRAMRSEARQAVLEADTRLQEIESRRRAPWAPGGDIGPLAGETTETNPPDGVGGPYDEPEEGDEPEAPPSGHRAAPSSPGAVHNRAGRESRGRAASVGAGQSADSDTDQLSTSRLRGPVTAPHPPSEERGSAARTGSSRPGAPGSGSPTGGRRGAGAGARGDAATGAKGGAAAGRPSIDRAQLEARLAAGAAIQITERFRMFEPVSQSHVKVCDWLTKAKTLADIEALAAGEVASAEILSVLILFFERSFLVLEN